ncbi:MAG: Glu/Leu/Phe/Val dehydrogenase [Pseudomonadota bacterium]|nr:Glu/Leu/Phe/Val dehydrogenase [Pseudomonadota bacterium]
MEGTFRFADELGPLKIVHVHLPSLELKGVLVVDNVAMGPSIGGLRMAPDVSTAECFRLARAMTLKNAAAALPHGGGKSVLYGDPKMPRDRKEELVRAFACALREFDQYIFGPDMGTDEQCMAWVKDEIGRSVGLPKEIGGIPLDEIGATGYGLSQATEVVMEHCDFELEGARIVLQGFGAVGKHTARFLAEKGALLVAAADSRGTIHNPNGLDIEELIALKEQGGCVADYEGGKALASEDVIGIECDIWIPAARPDVINEKTVDRLNTRLVVQGANIPFTAGAEKTLHERGILCLPDFIANAGGVICGAMEYRGATCSVAFDTIREKVRRNTALVLEQASAKGIPPRAAATNLARERLQKAMRLKRWGLF